MLRRDLLRSLMTTPLAVLLRPWVPRVFGDAVTERPNAALSYRKVFDWVKTLTSEESELLRKREKLAIDGPDVETLLKSFRPALQAMREAAAIDECDWGPSATTREQLGKEHLHASNVAAVYAACLSARRHARSHHYRQALDDLFAALSFAHRLGAGKVIISRLVESGAEVSAFKTLGRILPELDREARDDLSRRLAALPPPKPASTMIEAEQRFIVGSLRAELAANGPMIDDAGWEKLEFDKSRAEELRQFCGDDRTELIAEAEASGPAFAELARLLDSPRPGCWTALAEFSRVQRSTHPLVADIVESAMGARHVVDRMLALRAMLAAGIVLVRDGEPAFRAQPDPFGTGPFSLERRGQGYLIRSAMNDEGRPEVSLPVGETE